MRGRARTRRQAAPAAAWAWVAATALALGAFLGVAGTPAGVVVTLAGPGAAPATFATSEPSRAPARLSQTGLYDADGRVDPRNRPFAPQYPLWTDGARKSRWIHLPEGATIDVADLDAWRFPPGTTLWKEFAWGDRKVETRMLRLDADGAWTVATYVWTDDQTDALLAPADGVPAAFAIAPGRHHTIPGRADCLACHGSAPSAVLGFSALQLSDDRDPLAPHAEPLAPGAITLRTLVAEDRLSPPRPDLVSQPPRIRERDPVARAAQGYLSANCGGCHNDRGPLARLGFSLLHEEAAEFAAPELAFATTAGARGRFAIPGTPDGATRIMAPGEPERSALLHRMWSRHAAAQMPPLGTVIPDTAAVALVQDWIADLRVGGADDASVAVGR